MKFCRNFADISENVRQTFSHFSAKLNENLQNFVFFIDFAQILMKFCRSFADNLEDSEIFEFSNENS